MMQMKSIPDQAGFHCQSCLHPAVSPECSSIFELGDPELLELRTVYSDSVCGGT